MVIGEHISRKSTFGIQIMISEIWTTKLRQVVLNYRICDITATSTTHVLRQTSIIRKRGYIQINILGLIVRFKNTGDMPNLRVSG